MPRITVGPTCWKEVDVVRSCASGSSFGGGFLICKAGGTAFIVSPYSTEVSRNWHLREDANTTAQSASGCTGWFVPTVGQLQNPGFVCRSFWGPSPCFSSTPAYYWSSTLDNPNPSNGCVVTLSVGTKHQGIKTSTYCVRAFRCVTY